MRINGTNHYIGRSTSGRYITSDSRSSTRANTRTSSGYSNQSYAYNVDIYTNVQGTKAELHHDGWGPGNSSYENSRSYTWTAPIDEYKDTTSFRTYSFDSDGLMVMYFSYYTYYGHSIGVLPGSLTSTRYAYYTTIITNGVSNITISTTKSASSSSHNFV